MQLVFNHFILNDKETDHTLNDKVTAHCCNSCLCFFRHCSLFFLFSWIALTCLPSCNGYFFFLVIMSKLTVGTSAKAKYGRKKKTLVLFPKSGVCIMYYVNYAVCAVQLHSVSNLDVKQCDTNLEQLLEPVAHSLSPCTLHETFMRLPSSLVHSKCCEFQKLKE